MTKNSLNEILGFCGRRTLLEERNLFHDEKRPDITIQNPIKGGSNICIDCVVTGDTEGTANAQLLQYNQGSVTKKNMLDSNYYMNEIEKEKIRKYQSECDQNGVKFIPAAFTTKSNWSRGVEKLIDEHIEFLSDVKGYDKAIMTNWAKSKLAFKIAKALESVFSTGEPFQYWKKPFQYWGAKMTITCHFQHDKIVHRLPAK